MQAKTKRPTLSALVRRYRNARGLTLRDVADGLVDYGVPKTRGAVHHWERGGGIRMDATAALVDFFGLEGAARLEFYDAAGFVIPKEWVK